MRDYNTDFALWAREQAARLRAGAADLDRDNIAEELEALARALHGELDERMARLIQSLLQWSLLEGDRQPRWYVTIQEERDMIPRLLADAPSLRQDWPETLTRAWRRAQDDACDATGLTRALMPSACPFTSEQILDTAFWPGQP
ncbi:hypothetical protein OKW38_001545 [Paraburkholderia sp. MM5496-R1]|uniref:DUF29 domain-containing protein n=1 Tax=Paraburkholderia sp. MM5496-R1 TaxID=2991065 RepID=UPI003D21308F